MTTTTVNGMSYEVCCASCGCKGISKDCPSPPYPSNLWCAQWIPPTKLVPRKFYQEIYLTPDAPGNHKTLCVTIDQNEIILSEVSWEHLKNILMGSKK